MAAKERIELKETKQGKYGQNDFEADTKSGWLEETAAKRQ